MPSAAGRLVGVALEALESEAGSFGWPLARVLKAVSSGVENSTCALAVYRPNSPRWWLGSNAEDIDAFQSSRTHCTRWYWDSHWASQLEHVHSCVT